MPGKRNRATELLPSFKLMLTLNGWKWRRSRLNDVEWVLYNGKTVYVVDAVTDFGCGEAIENILDYLTNAGVFTHEQRQALEARYGHVHREPAGD